MRSTLCAACLGLVCAVAGGAAQATDGVIEINHARALAGSVTPGDTPGYPVTLSRPGSYRLTSNLAQPDAATHVIIVLAEDVLIDLNGFAITGANTCETDGFIPNRTISCTGAGVGRGISTGTGNWRTTVRNGAVNGLAGDCISVGPLSLVEDIQVSNCGGYGIDGNGSNGTAHRIRAFLNAGVGIHAATVMDSTAHNSGQAGIDGMSISNSSAHSNNSYGIYVSDSIHHSIATNNQGDGLRGRFITHSLARGNGGSGISSNLAGGNVLSNASISNLGYGLFATSTTAFGANQFNDNTAGPVSGGVVMPGSGNICNGSPC